MRKEPVALLRSHTVLPYVTAFMAVEDTRRIEERILQEAAATPCSLGSLLRRVSQSVRRPRYCPECVNEQLLKFGESYWRRSHNLPTTHLCVEHRRRLCLADTAPATASQYIALPLPHKQSRNVDQTRVPDWALVPLAESAVATLRADWSAEVSWPQIHRSRALAAGYSLTSGEVAGARLASELTTAYGSDYLAETAPCTDGCSWPSLMVREKPGVPFAAAKHVLLSTFLEWAPRSSTVFAYAKPGPRERDYEGMDRRLADAVMREASALLAAGATSTIQSVLTAAGGWQAFRHHRDRFPLTDAQIAAFKRTDASDRKTGGRVAHAKRLLAVEEGRQRPPKAWSHRSRSRVAPDRPGAAGT